MRAMRLAICPRSVRFPFVGHACMTVGIQYSNSNVEEHALEMHNEIDFYYLAFLFLAIRSFWDSTLLTLASL